MNMFDGQIRWLNRRDMTEVLEIEKESFESPWNYEDFICCLRQRNCYGMVADDSQYNIVGKKNEGAIKGFMIYELQKSKLHLLNFAVASYARRRGLGEKMVGKIQDKLSEQSRKEIYLEVRESNLGAQLFFQKQGFCATNVLRNWYDDSNEDAYVMKYSINDKRNFELYLPRNRISQYLGRDST